MNPARVVGVLFLIATVSYASGTQLLQSVLGAPDALANIHADRLRLIAGALLVLVDAAAVVGIATVLYPILKPLSERVALSYVAFRIMEAVLLVVGVLGPLSLIAVSEAHLAAGAPGQSFGMLLSAWATASNYWAYQLAMVLLGICGLLLCWLLVRSTLVPRWISYLGLVGYPLLSTGAVLDMLGQVDTLGGSGMVFLVPGGLFEIVLPVWLIAKGFGRANSVPASHESARSLRTTKS